jgi:hypothetical protein
MLAARLSAQVGWGEAFEVLQTVSYLRIFLQPLRHDAADRA